MKTRRQSRAWEIAMVVAAAMVLLGVGAVVAYLHHKAALPGPVPHFKANIGGWTTRNATKWT